MRGTTVVIDEGLEYVLDFSSREGPELGMVAEKEDELAISLKTKMMSDRERGDVCAKPLFEWELRVQDKNKVSLEISAKINTKSSFRNMFFHVRGQWCWRFPSLRAVC